MKRYLPIFFALELLLLTAFFGSPDFVSAQAVELKNPLAVLGINGFGDLVTRVFQWAIGIIGILAVAATVFNGFNLVVSGGAQPGEKEKINKAKRGLIWSVGGFIVALLAFTIVSGTAKILGFDPGSVANQDTLANPIIGFAQNPDFAEVMFLIMRNFLGLLGFATTLIIIYYGYRYITAAGNEEAVKDAKTGLRWAIIGFIVTILSFTMISIVRQLLLSSS